MLQQIRDSEAWKVLSDISLVNWLWTTAPAFAAGVAAVLHGIALESLIVLFLVALAAGLVIAYHWRKYQLLTKPRKKKAAVEKKNPWRFVVVPAAFLALVIANFLPVSTLTGSVIKIRQVEVLPPFYQDGQFEPGKRPLLNVHYYNSGTQMVTAGWIHDIVYVPSLPKDWNDNNERFEDQLWDRERTQLKYSKPDQELIPGKPMFFTIFDAPGLPEDMVQRISETQAIMYVMVVARYGDLWGNHESDFCGYIFGDPRVLHQCHKHNSS